MYNQHWSTLGGGEQLAGGIAAALARHHDVELLVNESFDAVVASERLGFDLTPFPQFELAPGTREFLAQSARYELLVNTSFANNFASRAERTVSSSAADDSASVCTTPAEIFEMTISETADISMSSS